MLAVGIIAGILIMATIYCISMYAYFVARQKHSESKYSIEIIAVVLAIVFSVGVKLAINIIAVEGDFTDGFASILHAIYSTIGGLTFEGLADLTDVENGLLQCLYTGSSLYAGLIVLSVITTKASYEIYCGIKLQILKIKLKYSKTFARKTDLYIFTSLTADSVLLAESIKEKYLTEKKDRHAEIIFAGELEVFTTENELCREIMANGFIFWSYSKKLIEEEESSVLQKLGLYIDNCFYKKDCIAKDSRIHIFALNNNKTLSGLECENSNIVFSEMDAILREYEKSPKKVFVDFYLLVDNEINYEVYKSKLDRINKEYLAIARRINERLSENKDNVQDVTGLESCYPFKLHLINEADYSSKDFIRSRDEVYKVLLPEKNLFDGAEVYKTMIIGFGQTGQSTMLQTFINTSNVRNRVPDKFVADVVDMDIDKVGGLFILRHPLIDGKVINESSKIGSSENYSHSTKFKEKLNVIYDGIYTQEEKDKLGGQICDDLIKKMSFPIVNLYKASCFGLPFIEYFDNKTGVIMCSTYNLIVISLGEDERNIAMANALLGDIRNELIDNVDKSRDITIAINIRERQNESRIEWGEMEMEKFPTVHIVKYGFADGIYSYDAIVDDSKQMMYSYPYKLLETKQVSDVYVDLVNMHNKLISEKGVDDNDYMDELQEIFTILNRNHDIVDIRKNWANSGLFDRESNSSVALFSDTMRVLCEDVDFTYDEMSRLVDIEHERWDRFHIAFGWTFRHKKNKPYRQHDCIVPTEKLKDEFGKYDLVNALRSLFEKENV